MNLSIRSFSAYANTANIDANQRVVLSDNGKNVQGGSADAGLRARHITVRQGGSTQAAENNRVRQELLDAVLKDFGVKKFEKLPASVRKAFNVGAFKNDMKLDSNGRVTSGRPLTARRIREVMVAVEKAQIPRLNRKLAGFADTVQKVGSFLEKADGALNSDLKTALKSFASYCEGVLGEGHQQKLMAPKPDTTAVRNDISVKRDDFIASLSKDERKAIKTFSFFARQIPTDHIDTSLLDRVHGIEKLFVMDERSGLLQFKTRDSYDEFAFLEDCRGLRRMLHDISAMIIKYEAQHPQG